LPEGSASGWPADSPETRRVLLVLLLTCALPPLIWAGKLLTTQEVLFPDFFGLWTFGRFVLTHPPTAIYDDHALKAFQESFGMPGESHYPFPYPPWLLLLLVPVGALPYAVARIGWLVLTFAAYAAALSAWRWQRRLIWLLLLAPSSSVCFLVGQNGFLSAALMLGGLRLLWTRPLLAGALLAAVAYKPQLAVLVPFALLFGGHWRAIAGAILAVIALSAAATVAFGVDMWAGWLANMSQQALALTEGRDALRDMMPTVTSAVELLGGSATLAHLAQAAAAAAGLLALWQVRARRDARALAVLPLATVLATPYAFDYDLPMVTGAVLAVMVARMAAAGRFGAAEFPVYLACIAAPALLPARLGLAAVLVPVVLAPALWIVVRGGGTAASRVPNSPIQERVAS